MKTIYHLKKLSTIRSARSAWNRGITLYMTEMLDGMEEEYGASHELCGSPADKKDLLNGADDWTQASDGGCYLIYDGDIAERLCSPSELKKNQNGERNPNRNESWLDVQARALHQAAMWIHAMAKRSY